MRDIGKSVNDYLKEIKYNIERVNGMIRLDVHSKDNEELILIKYYAESMRTSMRLLESEKRHSGNIWLNYEQGTKVGSDYLKLSSHFQEVLK
ncbi:MAG: hypothetical protein ACRCX8_20500 [Sarcina sp.]